MGVRAEARLRLGVRVGRASEGDVAAAREVTQHRPVGRGRIGRRRRGGRGARRVGRRRWIKRRQTRGRGGRGRNGGRRGGVELERAYADDVASDVRVPRRAAGHASVELVHRVVRVPVPGGEPVLAHPRGGRPVVERERVGDLVAPLPVPAPLVRAADAVVVGGDGREVVAPVLVGVRVRLLVLLDEARLARRLRPPAKGRQSGHRRRHPPAEPVAAGHAEVARRSAACTVIEPSRLMVRVCLRVFERCQ